MPSSFVTLTVRVTPRADRDALMGVRPDGVLLVRVHAAPVDGAANRAIQELLADALGVRRSAVALVGGATSREKRFRVDGLSALACDAWLASLPRTA